MDLGAASGRRAEPLRAAPAESLHEEDEDVKDPPNCPLPTKVEGLARLRQRPWSVRSLVGSEANQAGERAELPGASAQACETHRQEI